MARRTRLVAFAVMSVLVVALNIAFIESRRAPAVEEVSESAATEATEDEARAVANAWIAAVRGRDAAAFAGLVDAETVLREAVGGQQLPSGSLEALRAGVATLPDALFKAWTHDRDAAFRWLRSERDDAGLWAVIGVVHGTGGFNQVRLRIERVDEQARWVDQWSLDQGSAISDRLRQDVTHLRPDDGRLSEEEVRRLEVVTELSRRQASGDVATILDAWDSLPAEVRADKAAHRIRIAAALALGDDGVYRSALEDFVQSFPEDAGALVSAVDLRFMQGDHVGAGEAAEALHLRFGPDAYLLVIASSAYHRGGLLERARASAELAVAEEPDLLQARVQLLLVASVQGDEAAALQHLVALSVKHGVGPDVFADDPDWAPLRGLEAYSTWTGG